MDESNIDNLPTNIPIEKWVDKVLEVQGKLLKKEEDTTVASQDEEEIEEVTTTVTTSIAEEKKRIDDALKRYKCTHCDYKYVNWFFIYEIIQRDKYIINTSLIF